MPGRPTILMIVGQGLIALTVGEGGGCLDIFTLLYPFCPLSPSLWETARHRLKYCLKGPLNPKQLTNQSFPFGFESGIWDLTVLVPEHCLSFYFVSPLQKLYMGGTKTRLIPTRVGRKTLRN